MFLFTIFAFVMFWFYSSKGKDANDAANEGSFFNCYQVAAAGSTTDTEDSSLHDDLF